MLFKVPPANKDPFDANPEALAIPEFADLNPKMFRALILYADYKSPLRQKDKDTRFKLACMQAGYKIDSSHHAQLEKRARELFAGDNKYWEAGYKKYMELQHDEDAEILEMVNKQIDNIRNMVKTDTEDEAQLLKRNKILADLPGLIETKRRISRIMDREEEFMGSVEDEATGSPKQLSLIDKINEEEMDA